MIESYFLGVIASFVGTNYLIRSFYKENEQIRIDDLVFIIVVSLCSVLSWLGLAVAYSAYRSTELDQYTDD